MQSDLIPTLAAARKAHQMTQAQLAERAGLSRMTVQRTEGGDLDPRYSTLAEMARVLRPGGSLLIANLNSFSTAGDWTAEGKAASGFLIDNYLDERAEWESWNGMLIRNWHRPFHLYMQALLSHGLRLAHFDEPAPTDGDAQTVARYRRAPWLHIMEWVRDERAP